MTFLSRPLLGRVIGRWDDLAHPVAKDLGSFLEAIEELALVNEDDVVGLELLEVRPEIAKTKSRLPPTLHVSGD